MLHPSHAHSVFSATVLLMVSTFLSRIIGLVRVKYIVWLFGRGMAADAFNAAFVLPDMISYFLVGGAASITFVTILTRYRESGPRGRRRALALRHPHHHVPGAGRGHRARRNHRPLVRPLVVQRLRRAKRPRSACSSRASCCPRSLCFFAGGVFGAVLLVRKQFSVQAVAPLIYGLGTIVGGLLLVKRIGVSSLAIGTVAGAFFGPFLLNAVFARRAGTRYRFILDWHDEGLREWVRLSLPLMAGVSLVTADNWIIAHFASKIGGAVSLMSYAKQLFTAPMAMLAQAAGAASMPFFASLWTQQNAATSSPSASPTRSRASPALGLLAASGMVALGQPADRPGLYRRPLLLGRLRASAPPTSPSSPSPCFSGRRRPSTRAPSTPPETPWSPMVAGTIVTVVSLPIYAALYHCYGAMGLAIASDIGIALQTVTIAVLLHQRRMVSLASLDYAELGRCLLAAIASGAVVWIVFSWLTGIAIRHWTIPVRIADLAILILGSILWLAITDRILLRTGSALPKVARRRLHLG